MSDIPVKCTRCRLKHLESERGELPIGDGATMSICPRCRCRSYYDQRPWQAWCWASGEIHMGEQMPPLDPDGSGAITICSGPKADVEQLINVAARHGYAPGVRLVPGVPEAHNPDAAVNALNAWFRWLKQRRSRTIKFGA